MISAQADKWREETEYGDSVTVLDEIVSRLDIALEDIRTQPSIAEDEIEIESEQHQDAGRDEVEHPEGYFGYELHSSFFAGVRPVFHRLCGGVLYLGTKYQSCSWVAVGGRAGWLTGPVEVFSCGGPAIARRRVVGAFLPRLRGR